jgi:hypothetical protein
MSRSVWSAAYSAAMDTQGGWAAEAVLAPHQTKARAYRALQALREAGMQKNAVSQVYGA